MKMRHILLLVLLLLPLALSGCGNKGPLYMPEPEKKSN
ncbi:LPS translocon maturation chaperone LptM [Thiolapillus sp.]|nr:lipoprotein [Thiolapillus sp.]